MDLAPSTIDEAIQTLRARLFAAGSDGRPPLIASYSGRSRLTGWMRVVAVRDALQLLRAQKRVRLVDEEDLAWLAEAEGTPPPAGDVEREHMKLLYGAEFQRAFREAVASLPEREQVLLREHYLEGKSIDELGERYRVHRATAARWVERARRGLTMEIRRTMMRELQVDPATYQSVLRLVLSRADLSLRLVLGGEPKP
jgi:RNA polymerase sigma-70 factor (ECF subfamily)